MRHYGENTFRACDTMGTGEILRRLLGGSEGLRNLKPEMIAEN
jgi:hypothetical protein